MKNPKLRSRTRRHALFLPVLLLLCFSGWQCNENKQADKNRTALPAPPLPKVEKDTLTFNGSHYPTLRINGRTWLAENLDLPGNDAWCYQNKKDQCEAFGRLYRWQAAREACGLLGPDWRLPTDQDWQELAGAFGGYFDWLGDRPVGDPVAANQALLAGGAVSFNARLGGWRGSNGGFDSQGTTGFYWSGSEKDEDQAWFFIFQPAGGKLTKRGTKKTMGMSCRCVRD